MEIALNQQLLQGPVPIITRGAPDQYEFEHIYPQEIICDCEFEIEEATESLNRQERRQEQLLLFNTAVQAAPISAQLGVVVNLRPFWENFLESYDIVDLDQYLPAPPVQQGQPTQPPAGPQLPPAAPAQDPGLHPVQQTSIEALQQLAAGPRPYPDQAARSGA